MVDGSNVTGYIIFGGDPRHSKGGGIRCVFVYFCGDWCAVVRMFYPFHKGLEGSS